ncbi:MAG: DNA repair protein RecO [Actinobacteria bacterium]|jgi:DNA repair protein RecO (recombination protein O)|nr:DNA repair protein RecO [Actinomycetota bacterium]
MPSYHDRGIVLKTMRLGEADRIVTFMTEEHGKVRAVAKGVRKTTSKFGGRLEPVGHLSIMCWKGRDLDIVQQVQVLDSFRAIKEDYERLSQAAGMLEAVDKLSLEHHADGALYKMLLGALKVVESGNASMARGAFYFKALALEGTAPVVRACANCGAEDGLVAFNILQGGLLCSNCRSGSPISSDAIFALRLILGGGLSQALSETGSQVAEEIASLGKKSLEMYLDTRLKVG